VVYDAEVIVAGGGPAGSATAALLARAGHDVLLVDRARFPRPKACAEYLSPATADVLQRLGALAAVEERGPERPLGMQLIHRGRVQALVRYPDGAAQRRALCLSRAALDATLLQHAGSAGARVHEGMQVVGVRASATGTEVTVRHCAAPASDTRMLRARLVIGADGARSAVARSLGLQRKTLWPHRVGFVAHYRGQAVREYGEMHVGRGAYCGLAPLPEGHVNVGLVMGAAEARRAGGAEAAFETGMSRVLEARERLRGCERVSPLRGVAPLAARSARAYADGVLLVGDAAGFLDPITGEGVFRALRGAELAAEVAGQALSSGDCSARTLARYARLRREEFGAKDVLCWVIQTLLVSPPLLAYALRRIEARRPQGDVLGGVLGDYRPAADALRPSFLWGLLRP
jgi:menaquinone-9 beta-reductase